MRKRIGFAGELLDSGWGALPEQLNGLAYVPAGKTCSGCGQYKLRAGFFRAVKAADGLQGYCKKCARSAKCSPEQRLKSQAYTRQWNQDNPELRKEHRRANYRRHRAKRYATVQAWCRAHRDRVQEYSRNDYRKHLVKRKLSIRLWRQNNKARCSTISARRRARVCGAEGSFTHEEWVAKCAAYRWRCVYCGKRKKLERHHVIPVFRGGSNYIQNLAPVCRSCNASVGTRIVLPPEPRIGLTV